MTRRPEHKGWSKALFAKVVCTSSERKLGLLPAVQAQRQVYLTRGVVERFGPTAGCEECARKGGSHTHDFRTRLEECSTREGQARARADTQALEEALLSDADVLEEVAGGRMEVDDALVAAQEAKALARQGPVSAPAGLSTGSGGVLPSERSSQESLETHGCF